MSTYERYVEELLKLQRCYRIQNILSTDVISKIDLMTRPKVALTLSIALWCVSKVKQSGISYSDLVYVERRLAQFLADSNREDLHVIRNMFQLIPMRYGMSISLTSRRCGIHESLLVDIIKALNVIRDVMDMITVASRIDEPVRHSPSICLNDVDILPPTTANAREYLGLIAKALKENLDKIPDPVLHEVAKIIYEEVVHSDLGPEDFAAIVLIVKLIAENTRFGILCAEPCINIVTLSQKLLNDLATKGVEPYNSRFYKLYQEISARSVVHGSQK